jgi:hypothetical protein
MTTLVGMLSRDDAVARNRFWATGSSRDDAPARETAFSFFFGITACTKMRAGTWVARLVK